MEFGESICNVFARNGVVFLPNVLGEKNVESFLLQINEELLLPQIPTEKISATITTLRDSKSWPKSKSRRILEMCTPCVGNHWNAVKDNPFFLPVLDSLLGSESWDFLNNQNYKGPCKTRHWYSPVVFPENLCMKEEIINPKLYYKLLSNLTFKKKSLLISHIVCNFPEILITSISPSRSGKKATFDLLVLLLHGHGRSLKPKIVKHKKPKKYTAQRMRKDKSVE